MKLTQKRRWTIKRVLLLLISGLAGYDFAGEFAMVAAEASRAPVTIPAKEKKPQPAESSGLFSSWKERSLALLRKHSSTKRALPPLPPLPPSVQPTLQSLSVSEVEPSVYMSSPSASHTRLHDSALDGDIVIGAPQFDSDSREEPSVVGWQQQRGIVTRVTRQQDTYVGLVERD